MEMKYKGAFLIGILIVFIMAIGNVSAVLVECYQESANVSTTCGGLNTGAYNIINFSTAVLDGDWSTASNPDHTDEQTSYLYVNYSMPASNILALTKFQFKADSEINNITMNSTCDSSDGKVRFKIVLTSTGLAKPAVYVDTIIYCYNATEETEIFKLSKDNAVYYSFYEEGIFWALNVSDYNLTSSSYNSTAYETDYESFSANFSIHESYTSATANLVYDSAIYSATASGSLPNLTFTKNNLIVPQVNTPTNKSFYWNLLLTNSTGTYSINTSSYNQTVMPIYFTICNSTIGTQFLNFSGIDETLLTRTNFTIDSSTFIYWLGDGSTYETYQYVNTTENPHYRFCFNVNRTLNMNYTILYSGGDYFPRSRTVVTTTYSNATTSTILYLLGTASGVASTFITVDNSYNILTGATVTAQREVSGVMTTVATGVTDTSGSVTFYLNPFATHTITAVRNGCTKLYTINPSATTYQINVDCGTTTSYKSFLDSILYQRGPAMGMLERGVTTFDYYVTSDWGNNTILGIKFDLYDGNNGTLYKSNISYSGAPRCNGTACYASLQLDTTGMSKIVGRYYVITNLSNSSGYANSWILLEGDAQWYLISSNVSSKNTLKNLLADFKAIFSDINFEGNIYTEPTRCGEETDSTRKAEFSRFVFLFVGLAIVLAIIGRTTGYDAQNPGAFLFLLLMLVFVGSAMGGIHGEGLFYLKNLKMECPSGIDSYSPVAHFLNNWFLFGLLALVNIIVFSSVARRIG